MSGIGAGIRFLEEAQLSSGAFGMRLSRDSGLNGAEIESSPFFTALILHGLSHLGNMSGVRGIAEKATGYLLQEKEECGCWRFFGKGSEIAPDVDVTVCALAALRLNAIAMDYGAASSALLKYRDTEGMFATWIWEKPNCVDWVVNANALYFHTMIEKAFPAIEEYVCRIIRSGEFRDGSEYYKSPISGLYFFSRLCADRPIEKFRSVIPVIRDYLLGRQTDRGGWGNPLEDILAATALINTGWSGKEIGKAIHHILEQQQADGGWPAAAFSYYFPPGGIRYYGSREFNTAMALEALGHTHGGDGGQAGGAPGGDPRDQDRSHDNDAHEDAKVGGIHSRKDDRSDQ